MFFHKKICLLFASFAIFSASYAQSKIFLPPRLDEENVNFSPYPGGQRERHFEIQPGETQMKSFATGKVATSLSWEKMTSLSEGGDAQDIKRIGNKLYMSSSYELFVSDDEGSTWNLVLDGSYILLRGYLPNYFYGTDKKILTAGDSILFGQKFSVDGGNTWSSVTIDPSTIPSSFFAPTVLGMTGKEVYLGTIYNGFFHSQDFGKTFSPMNDGLPDLCGYYESPRVLEYFHNKPLIATISGIYTWSSSGWQQHAGHGLPTTTINGGVGYLMGGIDFMGDTWLASTNFGVYYSNDEGRTGKNLQTFRNYRRLHRGHYFLNPLYTTRSMWWVICCLPHLRITSGSVLTTDSPGLFDQLKTI